MIQKKKNTWHKNKTVPPKKQEKSGKPDAHKEKTNKKLAEAKHWVISRAKLVKIMEAAGFTPEQNITMLPRSRDR